MPNVESFEIQCRLNERNERTKNKKRKLIYWIQWTTLEYIFGNCANARQVNKTQKRHRQHLSSAGSEACATQSKCSCVCAAAAVVLCDCVHNLLSQKSKSSDTCLEGDEKYNFCFGMATRQWQREQAAKCNFASNFPHYINAFVFVALFLRSVHLLYGLFVQHFNCLYWLIFD